MDLTLDPAVAHTAIKTRKCNEIAERYYDVPKPLISEVVVGVPQSFCHSRHHVVPAPGFLRRISPAEPLHSLIIPVHRDVVNEEHDKLQQWKKILLNTLITFEIVERDSDLHSRNCQLREKSGIEFELSRHSSLSRCLDIVNFAARMPKPKKADKKSSKGSWAKQVSEAYNSGLVLSDFSEKVTESFVERSLTVNARMLTKSTAVVSKLLYLDDVYGMNGPLDSIHKLFAMLGKAGTGSSNVKRLEWMVLLLADLFETGALEADQCSKRELSNKLLDVLLAKFDLLTKLMKWANEAGLHGQSLHKMEQITVNLETYRGALGYSWLPTDTQPSCGWRTSFPPSADLFLTVLDGCIYSTTYDDVIVTWVNNKKALGELSKMAPLSDSLAEVTEKLEDCARMVF